MKFQVQILGLLATLPYIVVSAPAAAPEAIVARAPEGDDTLYQPLDYVYEGKRLNVKERAPEEDDTLYEPLDYVYEGKRLNVKKRAPENDDTLYEPLDYVYEGKRLNVKRE